jgi:hypothetical protein
VAWLATIEDIELREGCGLKRGGNEGSVEVRWIFVQRRKKEIIFRVREGKKNRRWGDRAVGRETKRERGGDREK